MTVFYHIILNSYDLRKLEIKRKRLFNNFRDYEFLDASSILIFYHYKLISYNYERDEVLRLASVDQSHSCIIPNSFTMGYFPVVSYLMCKALDTKEKLKNLRIDLKYFV